VFFLKGRAKRLAAPTYIRQEETQSKRLNKRKRIKGRIQDLGN
jgi:hypothetical protein